MNLLLAPLVAAGLIVLAFLVGAAIDFFFGTINRYFGPGAAFLAGAWIFLSVLVVVFMGP